MSESPWPRLKALTVGNVTHDRYGEEIRCGGSAFYGARALLALGAESHLVTSYGEEFACGRELAGLRVASIVRGRTTTFTNIYPESSARIQLIEHAGPKLRYSPACLPQDPLDLVFIAPVFGELDLEEWLDSVEARVIGLGLQGLMKKPGPTLAERPGCRKVVAREFAAKRAVLRGVDAVFLSEEDIAVFGFPGLLDSLIDIVPLVVLTRGEAKAVIYDRKMRSEVGAVPARVVDPTGAGDTYASAFLFGLAAGETPANAGRLAAAAASIVIEAKAGENLDKVDQARERRLR